MTGPMRTAFSPVAGVVAQPVDMALGMATRYPSGCRPATGTGYCFWLRRFGYMHGDKVNAGRNALSWRHLEWARRDSNPHSGLPEADFKSAASAGSATGPESRYGIEGPRNVRIETLPARQPPRSSGGSTHARFVGTGGDIQLHLRHGAIFPGGAHPPTRRGVLRRLPVAAGVLQPGRDDR